MIPYSLIISNVLHKDHSLPGRSKINVKSTRFGDEVYRGCFEDTPADQLFSFKMSTEVYNLQHMTPEWCIRLCRLNDCIISKIQLKNKIILLLFYFLYCLALFVLHWFKILNIFFTIFKKKNKTLGQYWSSCKISKGRL